MAHVYNHLLFEGWFNLRRYLQRFDGKYGLMVSINTLQVEKILPEDGDPLQVLRPGAVLYLC